jgi:hypothetical protein
MRRLFCSPLLIPTAVLAWVAAVTACSVDKGVTTAHSQSTSGSETADGTTAIPTATAPEEDKGDYGKMEECELDMACEPFAHLHTGDVPYHQDMSTGYLDVERCILAGLRDGKVGRYLFGTHYDDGTLEDLILHVHADRTVTFAQHTIGVLVDENGPHSVDIYEPAATCELKESGFFADCLMNHDDATHYYECMQPWFITCTPSEPRCE